MIHWGAVLWTLGVIAWESVSTPYVHGPELAGLVAYPPLLAGLALLLWRWIRAAE